MKSLSLESCFNYQAIDVSPNGALILAVNEKGQAQLISTVSYTVVRTHKFQSDVISVKFSPNGKHFAVVRPGIVLIFKTPGHLTGEFGGFVLEKYFSGAFSDFTYLDWSSDSRFVAVGSKDNMTRIFGIGRYEHFRITILAGHTDQIQCCFFEKNSMDMNTISRNGQLCLWECNLKPDELTPIDGSGVKLSAKKIPKVEESDEEEDAFDAQRDLEQPDDELEKRLKRDLKLAENPEESSSTTRDSQGKLIEKSTEVSKRDEKLITYKRLARHYLATDPRKENPQAILSSTCYHKDSKILVTAFSTGAFYLHELPDMNLIHSLNISEHKIDASAFNVTGDWIALGVSGVGQLLVWEWQSEHYILKQQGHSSDMTSLAYSGDGQTIVTGGDDGKLKLWNAANGFCIVTFSEHSGPITAVEFSQNKKILVSAALDGTVRAFDIVRYRNFRTFTSPRPVQFSCVAIDYSGELVAAGAQDEFEIFLWSMKLGKLLEVISGHEGPIVSLTFSPMPTSSTLVSGSWDKSIRVWNCLEASGAHETIELMSDVVHVAFHPNGEEVAAATINGNITVFNVRTRQQVAQIEGRTDLGSSVSETDIVTAKTNQQSKYFTTITYSADGECILAGGKSTNICIYHIREGILLKKFEITQNRSLDGLNDFVNRRNLTEFGNMALIENRQELEGGDQAIQLPGVLKGDMSSRNLKPEVNVFSVRFSPSGVSFAATCTEGLMIYSLDKGIVFDPYQLSVEVTPKSIREHLDKKEYSPALLMSLKLNEFPLIHECIERIPIRDGELLLSTYLACVDLSMDEISP